MYSSTLANLWMSNHTCSYHVLVYSYVIIRPGTYQSWLLYCQEILILNSYLPWSLHITLYSCNVIFVKKSPILILNSSSNLLPRECQTSQGWMTTSQNSWQKNILQEVESPLQTQTKYVWGGWHWFSVNGGADPLIFAGKPPSHDIYQWILMTLDHCTMERTN